MRNGRRWKRSLPGNKARELDKDKGQEKDIGEPVSFFEGSRDIFKQYPDTILLDIFHKFLHNNSVKIDTKESAWLALLSEDSPEVSVCPFEVSYEGGLSWLTERRYTKGMSFGT